MPCPCLARDEREAIDKSNIIGGDRTRHAKPQNPTGYSEGPDEDQVRTHDYDYP